MKIAAVVGARPNFVKIAPIVAELRTRPEATTMLIHTGQHYDGPMSDAFFANLELPDPDVNLRVQAPSATAQIAEIMLRLEPVLCSGQPDLVLVVGDVNSTLAASHHRNQAGDPAGACGGGSPELRPNHARGNQSGLDRLDLRSALHHGARGQ